MVCILVRRRDARMVCGGKELKPLQAADVVAYEIFKHVENQILDGGQRHPRRLSALDLFRRQDERYVTFWNKDRLIHWLAECDREHPFGDIPADQLDQALRRKQGSASLPLQGIY